MSDAASSAPLLPDAAPAGVRAFVDALVRAEPAQRDALPAALARLDPGELDALGAWLDFRVAHGRDVVQLAEDYLALMRMFTEEQFAFQRSGAYRNSTFAQALEEVYRRPDEMQAYMEGLATSTFLWSNHLEMYRFFRTTFPAGRGGRYLEVGPGHGFFFRHALEVGAFDVVRGIDVSETSIALTRQVLEHFHPGLQDRVELTCTDFLDATALEPGSFDVLVMGEVVEHVEDPLTFLRRLRDLGTDDAWFFVTTCANAPAPDHIFLFRACDDIRALLDEAGFAVVDALELGWDGRDPVKCARRRLPINVAYALRKA
ncbi:MAG: class I SAM-dependent methyltransferase [Myxococcales bacterium]|nr:class I SAM-dependent methyltransferase [Myxococcales bacterium]MCB9664485.1 class I SAM-dependent methyltransferase [Alphaproteobacteria bacterium]